MKANVLLFLLLAALLGVASGLTVGPVRLCNHRRYLSYRVAPSENTSLIECPYQLAAGEEMKRVYWEMWNGTDQVGTYEWDPVNRGHEATGRLEGVVALNRDDGGLQLTELRYNLLGDYLCGVELTNGQSNSSSKEEVLVVDIAGGGLFDQKPGGKCNLMLSYSSPAVYPEPTVRAGMFSKESDDYYETVTEWNKIYNNDGSAIYSFENAYFEIDESKPEDVGLKVDMGVTKSDGTFISLRSVTLVNMQWNEHGCPDVKEEVHKKVLYIPNNNVTCRGGHENGTMALVRCQAGYLPGINGTVVMLHMTCNSTTLAWQVEGKAANTDNLQCVIDDGSKAVVSNGRPSLDLLFASLVGVTLLYISSRP